MRYFIHKVLVLAVSLFGLAVVPAMAQVNYSTLSSFNAAVGPHTIIPFTTLPDAATITTEYSGLGVTFVDGNDLQWYSSVFVTDNAGVDGDGQIELTFSTPVYAIGAEFPGAMAIDLYNGATLIGTSANFGGSGTGFFGGVTFTPFNRAILRDWGDNFVFIDNLHFAPVVPEPGALALLGCSLLCWAVRRR